ncbi:hypothetical protein ADK34_02335 [Streptomyces viridochromogenes]|uniref:Uncharacterized protein n=1 Tax=Streptomyces viridochromogenes TaxID=1938 RepID=A0A0L8LDW8_STRVR|nr:hypothetical protein ADK34_02335 [Streptomyces viridochromogenes]
MAYGARRAGGSLPGTGFLMTVSTANRSPRWSGLHAPQVQDESGDVPHVVLAPVVAALQRKPRELQGASCHAGALAQALRLGEHGLGVGVPLIGRPNG